MSENKLTTFTQYFLARKHALAAVIPKTMTPERLLKVALFAMSKNPKLLQCTPESVYIALHQGAQLGLETGSAAEHAYLVPYKNECKFQIGYKGLVLLAWRTAEILIRARVVHENDFFLEEGGLEEDLQHRPADGDRGPIKKVYAVAKMKDGRKEFEVMDKSEVDAIRNRSRAANDGPWVTDYLQMAKKTVVRRLCGMLPISVEFAEALAADDGEAPSIIPDMGVATDSRAEALADELGAPALPGPDRFLSGLDALIGLDRKDPATKSIIELMTATNKPLDELACAIGNAKPGAKSLRDLSPSQREAVLSLLKAAVDTATVAK